MCYSVLSCTIKTSAVCLYVILSWLVVRETWFHWKNGKQVFFLLFKYTHFKLSTKTCCLSQSKREYSDWQMFRSTGAHQGGCNGAGTRGKWWIVPADHTTKSSELVFQYINLHFPLFWTYWAIALTILQTFRGLILRCRDWEQRGARLFVKCMWSRRKKTKKLINYLLS